MKKFIFLVFFFITAFFMFADEITLFQGKGFNESGKEIDFNINYEVKEKQLRFYINDLTYTYIFIYSNNDIIHAIDKVIEWDKVANDNNIKTVKRDITEFNNTNGFFKYKKEWHKITGTRSAFYFSRTENKSGYAISARKLVASENSSLITDYPNLFISVDILNNLKKAISDEVINNKLDEIDKESKKNDRLFK